MKVLLFPNGSDGGQKGIEDGFKHLLLHNKISDLSIFYLEDYAKNHCTAGAIKQIWNLSYEFQPDLIVFFHISYFPIEEDLILNLKKLNSKPIIAYDEGDMYGGWGKPISPTMRMIFRNSDVISIRGLGKWYETVKKYNSNIIYTPHTNNLFYKTKEIIISQYRKEKFIFIGNRVTSRLGRIRRLPGAYGREKFVKIIDTYFKSDFKVYGNGWLGLNGNMGPLDFSMQTEVCNNSWIHLSYEHYPEIPYYFSDRLPIALASGQIYICHYHEGYEHVFKNCDFIYFFKTNKEAIDIMRYVSSLSENQLYEKSLKAKEWADQNLSPRTTWSNFFYNTLESLKVDNHIK